MDGSGKTTLTKLLVEELKKRGFKCNYVYGRYKPLLSRPVFMLGKLLVLRRMDKEDYEEYSRAKKDTVGSHLLWASIYQKILLFDYSLQLVAKILLPTMFRKIIICDRYVYDTVINDIPRADDSIGYVDRLIERCFYIAPKPDFVFLIDLPEEVAYKRKDDVPSIAYLKERRGIYLEIGAEYDMRILDGCKDLSVLKEQAQKEILDYIKRVEVN
jgi:dTMP kinase